MKTTAQSALINQRPFHGLSGNPTAASARHAHRKVEKQSGLLNAINSIISYVKNSFRALEDFVCEACIRHDVTSAYRDLKHNSDKAYNKCRLATATSKTQKAKYLADDFLADVQYNTSKLKDRFNLLMK